MTVVVNTYTEQEKLALLDFLESRKYDFHTDASLTSEQIEEVLKRDKEFSEGKTTSRPWGDIIEELNHVYR